MIHTTNGSIILTAALLTVVISIGVIVAFAGDKDDAPETYRNLDDWNPTIISRPVTPDKSEAPQEIGEPARSFGGVTEGDIIEGTITYYDVCYECCGKVDGITASGLIIENGVEPREAVCGCNWLPLRSRIEIDGTPYIVADRGGHEFDTVGRVDVFNPNGHADSIMRGIVYGAEIKIIEIADD